MNLLFINPNSSDAITKEIEKEAKHYQGPDLRIDVKKCEKSPPAIAMPYDDLVAGINVIQLLQEEVSYDAAVIGCFGDPGLAAARSMVKIPVVGLFESSLYFAKLNGIRYSIVTTGDWSEISPWYSMLRAYGETENLSSVHCLNASVEGALDEPDERIVREMESARKVYGADAVILACSAFAGRAEELAKTAEIPVIDGIKESIYLAKMLAEYHGC